MSAPVVLSVAGSDSSGGAGIQADLRTFGALRVFGTTAVTAVTAQNLQGVHAVHGIPPDIVRQQIAAAATGFSLSAVKTGMLWSGETVRLVASELTSRGAPPLVVDPVMIATSGGRLMGEDALEAYREALIPICRLLTPNLDEAATLLRSGPIELRQMPDAVRQLARTFGCAVLLKGGHLEGAPVDMLVADGKLHRWRHPRLAGINTHGSGCMLSAAIAAQLGLGKPLPSACEHALAFVHDALSTPLHPSGTDDPLAHIEVALTSLAQIERQS